MRKLTPFFTREKASGIYRFGSWAKPESILTAIEDFGWKSFHIDGQQINNKASFIQHFADVLAFPNYHGSNWDAFEDCITDMAWLPAPGYVVLFDKVRHFARQDKDEWQMAKTILSDAANYWQSKNKPMVVLLRHTWWTNWDVEKI